MSVGPSRIDPSHVDASHLGLQLFALAYNLGNFLRRLAMGGAHRSLTTPREMLIKIGAGVVRTDRYLVCQMEEVTVPRHQFRTIPDRIHRLRPAKAVSG